eukprot:1146809-Pelagomonas_calceolata.AAC.4
MMNVPSPSTSSRASTSPTCDQVCHCATINPPPRDRGHAQPQLPAPVHVACQELQEKLLCSGRCIGIIVPVHTRTSGAQYPVTLVHVETTPPPSSTHSHTHMHARTELFQVHNFLCCTYILQHTKEKSQDRTISPASTTQCCVSLKWRKGEWIREWLCYMPGQNVK